MKFIIQFILLLILYSVLASPVSGQIPDVSEGACLVDVNQAIAENFDLFPMDSIPEGFQFDTVWAEGDCESSTLNTQLGPVMAMEIWTLEWADSCELQISYNQMVGAMADLNDTSVNACELNVEAPVAGGRGYNSLIAAPNPFQERISIQYRFDQAVSSETPVRLKFFSSSGAQVFNARLNLPGSGNTGTFIWSGKNMVGELVPAGKYLVVLDSPGKNKALSITLRK
ncbi:hypothetical protein ACFL5V_03810 [Fibrobacterota bacterium]